MPFARVRYGTGPDDLIVSEGLRDVSEVGLFFVTRSPLAVGTEVSFDVWDDRATRVAKGFARVVLVQPGSGMGLEFLSAVLSPADVARLNATLESLGDGARPDALKVATKAAEGRPGKRELTIGIDLGTSNTCASAVIDGKPQVIPTRYGTTTIPSVVTVDRKTGKLLVGDAAARRMILEPHRTVYGSKRLIGRSYSLRVAEEYQPFFAYPIVEAPGGRFGASLEGHIISMEEVARHILAEVRMVAERHLKTRVRKAVITVPAYFNERQREAVRRAGHAAGLEVPRVLNEPTAAAITYGYDREERARLAVFDLGGGTFDISVLQVHDNRFEVVACGGDNFLGGIDFDDLIASYFLEDFCRVEHVDLQPDPQQLARLREAAEEAKRGLSVQTKVLVHLPQFALVRGQLRDLGVSLARDQMEEMIEDLVYRMLDITASVLNAAKITPNDLDDVLLVGGMSRAPAIASRVEDFFGRRPSRRINPDEAVALGAALLADELDAGGKLTLVDVVPMSVGIAGEGRTFIRLIPRNTTVPTERSLTLRTSRADQRMVSLPLFQGEMADAAANEFLGTAIITNVPPGPAGSQAYEVKLLLDQHCVLSVRAWEPRSRIEVPVRLDHTRSVQDIIDELGPYKGPALKTGKRGRKESALSRIFSQLTRFWSRG
jgi:molecular chaperone DnaK (HSP70)